MQIRNLQDAHKFYLLHNQNQGLINHFNIFKLSTKVKYFQDQLNKNYFEGKVHSQYIIRNQNIIPTLANL